MHGRQKVERSAEEEAKKQTERDQKVAAYKYATSKIFAKRANKELGKDLLDLTGKVLVANPDIWTLWNIRREILLTIKANNVEEFEQLVQSELDITEAGLRQNPKSYGAWYHRYWLMMETNFVMIDAELKLCAKYLQYDDRNFHCWDYRKFLVDHHSSITAEDQIKFTTEKIKNNFSNYSSWHLRSKVLPQLTPAVLAAELDLIQNAAFTDPNDQSVWFYHKWLVNTHLQNVAPALNHVSHAADELYLVFNLDVLRPSMSGLSVTATCKSSKVTDLVSWENPWRKPKCKVWKCHLLSQEDQDPYAAFHLKTKSPIKVPQAFVLDEATGTMTFPSGQSCSLEDDTSPDFSRFLTKELAWVQELHEVEPDNKWAILTMIHLLRLVDFPGNAERIWDLIERLKVLDSKRVQYYNDLSKNVKLERELLTKLDINPRLCSYILPPF